jgi:hypothetical protein
MMSSHFCTSVLCVNSASACRALGLEELVEVELVELALIRDAISSSGIW